MDRKLRRGSGRNFREIKVPNLFQFTSPPPDREGTSGREQDKDEVADKHQVRENGKKRLAENFLKTPGSRKCVAGRRGEREKK